MAHSKLALHGGIKTIKEPFKLYNSIGTNELEAATAVIKSGVLSKFLGAWHADFYGGPKVLEFESKCASYFGVKHAITVNSWTSGLIAAVGAIGIEPGDEIIVSPWTMCASATAILHWNAIPVFADIDRDSFCISPESIEANITPYTKAIMAIDIFGQSADIDAIAKIAKKYSLKIISDSAQAPGVFYKNKYAGTLSDIGGYSLNYHKHIHTGEGGILVTNNDLFAERLKLIRNHAEAVVSDMGVTNISNMIGYNFRLGEIECAIGIEQLNKLDSLVSSRQKIAERLNRELGVLKGLKTPVVRQDCTHAYYIYAMVIDTKLLGVDKIKLLSALQAEGVPGLSIKYQNIHLLPIFQKKIAYGTKGFPWTSDFVSRDVSYQKGICPISEELNEISYLGFSMCMFDLSDKEIDLFVSAFKKVWANIDTLGSFN
jgi:dTDP-4-amino-4,6-dideoxygalactose transaminase